MEQQGHVKKQTLCLTLRETAQLFLKVLNATLHSHQQCMRVPPALLYFTFQLCVGV